MTFTAPATAEATAQIPFIQEQVQRGIDVLAIQANSVDALNSILDDVRAKGILVIATNADIDGNESHRDAAVLAVDFDKVGMQMLDSLYDQMGGKGKFAIISATTDAPAQKHFIEEPGGVKDLLQSDPKYKDMELLEVAYGDDVPQKSLTECEALLAKYPDMNAIMAPTTVAVAAAASASNLPASIPVARTPRMAASSSTAWAHPTRCVLSSSRTWCRASICGIPPRWAPRWCIWPRG